MSDQNKPEFISSIPKHLIEGETPAMQYLITELNKNTQATEYLLRRREESGVILDSINKKLDYTNGSIAEAKREIFDLQEKAKKQEEIHGDIEDIVGLKRFAQKYLFNKYALIGIGIFVLGLFKVITTPELRELISRLVGF